MNIPNDTGHPWRLNKFLEYHIGTEEEDTPLLIDYANANKLTKGQRIWLAFLYSTCYCAPTALLMIHIFPSITDANPEDLEQFWNDYKHILIFQSDRKYAKNMNWFIPMITNFKARTADNPVRWAKALYNMEEPETTYNAFYNEINNWKYFGRFSTTLLIMALTKIADIKMDASWVDWRDGQTVTEGLLHVLYLDETAEAFRKGNGVKLTLETLDLLNKRIVQIHSMLEKRYPQPQLLTDITSSLCGFRKLFKGTRYSGYYQDRQLEDLNHYKVQAPEYRALWSACFESRKAHMNHDFLGELNGWTGIRKELMTQWLDKGVTGVESAG